MPEDNRSGSLPPTPKTQDPTSSPAVVQANSLTKIYGRQRAVDEIDLAVSRGETFGLLGPNGAGKSTTMRMIACRTPLSSGQLFVEGRDVRTQGREIRFNCREYLPEPVCP